MRKLLALFLIFMYGTLSAELTLTETEGKILAAHYNKENRFMQVEIYNAKEHFTVGCDDVLSGDKVKIMWWSSEKTINPISGSVGKWVSTYIVK